MTRCFLKFGCCVAVGALCVIGDDKLADQRPSIPQLEELFNLAMRSPINDVRILATRTMSESPSPREKLEKEARLVADSLTPSGRDHDGEYQMEFENALTMLRDQNESRRGYKEEEWIVGRQYRYDQSVVLGESPIVLLEDGAFHRSYIQPGDIWSGDFRTYYFNHSVRSAAKDTRQTEIRAPLGLSEGARIPNEMRTILISAFGSRRGKIEIVFDRSKAERLAGEGDEGIQVFTRTVEGALWFQFVSNGKSEEPRVTLGVKLNDFSKVVKVELYDPDGQLVYLDSRYDFRSDGFPSRWHTIQRQTNGMVTNQIEILEVEFDPKLPEGLFEFNPPEDYSIVDGDRMIRNVMFGGERLPMGHVIEVRSNESDNNGLSIERKRFIVQLAFVLVMVSVGMAVWRKILG